ncbi:BAR-domain-containing protein [Auricularia subglabra TFB-10046 SS5]|nr:BAR-domain-containing protein [Auricularia subglabra TFB-10046 SS5]
MAGKQLGKLKQWAGEMITFSKEEKTALTDEFLELEHDIELRRVGVERLHSASTAYHAYLLKKKQSDALAEPAKVFPVEALGLVMINHGEEFGDESAFGQSLVKYGRAQLKLASLQADYAEAIQEGYISNVERTLAEISEYQAQRKKLDSRRLTYDAALSKASKQFKKDKEQKEAEDELARAKDRYEEVSEDVQARMTAIQENEVQQWHDLTAFLDVHVKYAMDYLAVLQDVKEQWIDESSIKRLALSRAKSNAHSFPRAATPTKPARKTAPPPDSDSDSPTTTAKSSSRAAKSDSLSRSTSSAAARKRADSSGAASSAKRISMPGWAASVASIGRSGGGKDRDGFAHVRDNDNSGDEGSSPERPASRGSTRTLSKRSPSARTAPLPPVATPKKIQAAPSQQTRKVARALFDYAPSAADELPFRTGDEITVLNEVAEEWWQGETADGRRGLFPCSYVEVVPAAALKKAPPLPTRPRLGDSSGGSSGSLSLQEKARRALGDEPEPPPTPNDDDVFGDARYAVSARHQHHDETEESDDDSDDEGGGRPLVRKASSTSVGRNGAATPSGKKAPPPPPPSRRSTGASAHSGRSQSVGSLAGVLKGPFGGGSAKEEESKRSECEECGCADFAQNKFKARGYCNSCFHVHPPA